MTSFLLEYTRRTGQLEVRPFDDPVAAMTERFIREAAVDSGVEVVVLSSESEAALRRTHSRYFETVSEILDGSRAALTAS